MKHTFQLIAVLSLTILSLIPHSGAAAQISCSTTDLINAIQLVNATPENDTIELANNCTYTLSSTSTFESGLPAILRASNSGSVTIEGNNSIIQRSEQNNTPFFRIVTVNFGGDLTLQDLTIRNGRMGDFEQGIGILNQGGTVTLENVTIADNVSLGGNGGGISNDRLSTLIANNSTFTNNSAGRTDGNTVFGGFGGAITNAGQMTITDTVFNGNTVTLDGGAIYNSDGSGSSGVNATLIRVTIDNNTSADFATTAGRGDGGGISNTTSGKLEVVDSIISNNFAKGDGGGVYNTGILTVRGTLFDSNTSDILTEGFTGGRGGGLHNQGDLVTVENSVFLNNRSNAIGGGMSTSGFEDPATISGSSFIGNSTENSGGTALYIAGFSGPVTVTNSTFAQNTNPLPTSTIYADGSDADLTLVNSTVANNNGTGVLSLGTLRMSNTILFGNSSQFSGADCRDTSSPPNFGGGVIGTNNLIGDGNGCDDATNQNLILGDPVLGSLTTAPNGTRYLPLLAGSRAINLGSNAAANTAGLITDQLGNPRIANSVIDIGAFEFGSFDPAPLDVVQDGIISPEDAIFVLNRINTTNAEADVNDDGIVNMIDVNTVISNIGLTLP